MNIGEIIDSLVRSIAWRYFYLIALGMGFGFLISDFEQSNNVLGSLLSILSSSIALYWNYRLSLRGQSDGKVKE